jgi:hypothetical protein
MPTPERRINSHNAADYPSIYSQVQRILLPASRHEKEKIAGSPILHFASRMRLEDYVAFGGIAGERTAAEKQRP